LISPFALFVVKKPFLDGGENFAIGTLNNTVGLWVVHWGEDRLGANGKAEIPEVLAVELFAVVDVSSDRTPKRQTMFCQKIFERSSMLLWILP
jgi:uncharacterized protein (UPF0261 family)